MPDHDDSTECATFTEDNPLDDVGVLADPARNLRAVIANSTVHMCDL